MRNLATLILAALVFWIAIKMQEAWMGIIALFALYIIACECVRDFLDGL